MTEIENKIYKLQLEGDGIAVTKNVTEETARRIMNLIMGAQSGFVSPTNAVRNAFVHGVSTISPSTANEQRLALPAPAATSPREYLDETGAKTNPEKILALASHLVDSNGAETFSSEEVKTMFPRSREPIPGNYSRDFRWVESNGWIAESPQENGRFYITNTGRKAISGNFPKELSKAQPGYLKRKKKAKSINKQAI